MRVGTTIMTQQSNFPRYIRNPRGNGELIDTSKFPNTKLIAKDQKTKKEDK